VSGARRGDLPDAVVFDCDGTLADSEPLAQRAWAAAVGPLGYDVRAEDLETCLGRSYEWVHGYFSERAPALPAAQDHWPVHVQRMLDLIESVLQPFDDAVALARRLADSGVPLAIATSSPRVRLDATLRALGLQDLFVVTVARDEVLAAKPAPDAFLRAAELLGAAPHRCVAVEDSLPGVASAVAAGMRVLAVRRAQGVAAHPGLLPRPDLHIVDDLTLDSVTSLWEQHRAA